MILNFDGSYLLHRCMYKLNLPDWERMAEMFVQRLVSASFNLKLSKIIVLWDKGLSIRRISLYKDYKANRKKDPKLDEAYNKARDILHVELPMIGVYSVLIPGYEADDLAQIVMLKNPGGGIHVSDDKDWFLNIDKKWMVYRPLNHEKIDYDKISEELETDLPYGKYLYMKALMGDVGDNVPGLAGIGPSNAKKYAEILMNKELIDSDHFKKIIDDGYEIFQRNLEIFDTRWILYDDKIIEEFDRQTKTIYKCNLIDWIRFCNVLKSENLLKEWMKWDVILSRLG